MRSGHPAPAVGGCGLAVALPPNSNCCPSLQPHAAAPREPPIHLLSSFQDSAPQSPVPHHLSLTECCCACAANNRQGSRDARPYARSGSHGAAGDGSVRTMAIADWRSSRDQPRLPPLLRITRIRASPLNASPPRRCCSCSIALYVCHVGGCTSNRRASRAGQSNLHPSRLADVYSYWTSH